MTFTVETGAGVANANAYITLVEAASYHTLMGNDDWSGSDTDLENAIIKGTAAVELLYAPKYLSQQLNASQSLRWPRYAFYDNYCNLITQNTIPQALKNAVAEAALLALNGTDLYPEPNVENILKRQKDKVGELETESEYFKPQENTTYENYRKVELQLYPILFKKSKSMNFTR